MKRSLLALTLLVALPFAATAAEGLSYTYVEGGYAATDADLGDADGYEIIGSAAIAPNFHLFGSYSSQETEGFNVDVDQWRLGVGYNHEVARNTDLLTRVAYARAEVLNESFDGYSVEAGVRTAFTPMLEGYALAGYQDGSDFDGDFYGRVGGQVKFNQTWGVSGDVKFSDGDTQYFVGPRITF